MIMYFVCHIFWFSCLVPGYIAARNQVPVNSRVHRNSRTCNGAVDSALVEKFFNYVFNEFRENPPVCLCVQMCVGQYTYCFPNGCMKQKEYQSDTTTKKVIINKDNIMKFTENRYHVPKDKNPFVGFYDDIQMSDLVSSHAHTTPSTPSTENQFIENFHTDLFKQHYKSVFKNRRKPKFQFRYNLRELVKHRNDYVSSDINADRAIWPYKINKVSSQILFEFLKPYNIILQKSQSLGNKLSYYRPKDTNYVKREVSNIIQDEDNTILKSLKKVDPLSENNSFSIDCFASDDLLDDGIVKRNNSKKRNEYFVQDMKNAETILDSQIEQVNLPQENVTSEIRINIMKLEEHSPKYLNADKINIVKSVFEPTTEFHPEISRVQNIVGFVDRPLIVKENVDTRTKKQLSRISRIMLEAKKRIVLPPKRKRTKPFV